MLGWLTTIALTLALTAPETDRTASPTSTASPHAPAQVARSVYVEGTLNLAVGERVTLRGLDDGTFQFVKAEVVGLEAALPPATGSHVDMAALMAAQSGTIAFTLGLSPDVGSFLKIENGLAWTFKFVGFIVRFVGGREHGPHRTSVCTVPSGKLGFEHWPEPVIHAVLGELQLVEGDRPVCESHDVND